MTSIAPSSASQAKADRAYRPLGMFRFLLAMLVLISHSDAYLPGFLGQLSLGNVGVFLFFVVSGFVISEALDLFYRDASTRFLMNRALKIFPAYWAATLFAYAVLAATEPASPLFQPWPVAVNLSLLLSYLPAGSPHIVLSMTWAVIVEIQFYLLAALTVVVGSALRRRGPVVTMALALSLVAYLYVWATGSQARFFGGFYHAPFFVLGCLLYWTSTRPAKWLVLPIALCVLLSLHAFAAYVGRGDVFAGTAGPTAVFLVLLGLLFHLCRAAPRPELIGLDRRLGDVTYAIYLIHAPVIAVAVALGLESGVAFLFVVASSLGLAFLIHRFVEMPIFGVRDRLRGLKLYG